MSNFGMNLFGKGRREGEERTGTAEDEEQKTFGKIILNGGKMGRGRRQGGREWTVFTFTAAEAASRRTAPSAISI
jgi:hypothetical protein